MYHSLHPLLVHKYYDYRIKYFFCAFYRFCSQCPGTQVTFSWKAAEAEHNVVHVKQKVLLDW